MDLSITDIIVNFPGSEQDKGTCKGNEKKVNPPGHITYLDDGGIFRLLGDVLLRYDLH